MLLDRLLALLLLLLLLYPGCWTCCALSVDRLLALLLSLLSMRRKHSRPGVVVVNRDVGKLPRSNRAPLLHLFRLSCARSVPQTVSGRTRCSNCARWRAHPNDSLAFVSLPKAALPSRSDQRRGRARAHRQHLSTVVAVVVVLTLTKASSRFFMSCCRTVTLSANVSFRSANCSRALCEFAT